MKKSWLVMKKEWGINSGAIVQGVKHKMVPLVEGKNIKKTECEKCKSNNCFVFVSVTDRRLELGICMRCEHKFWVKQAKSKEVPKEVANTVPVYHQCEATTTSGKRCKNKAVGGLKVCSYHNKYGGGK